MREAKTARPTVAYRLFFGKRDRDKTASKSSPAPYKIQQYVGCRVRSILFNLPRGQNPDCAQPKPKRQLRGEPPAISRAPGTIPETKIFPGFPVAIWCWAPIFDPPYLPERGLFFRSGYTLFLVEACQQRTTLRGPSTQLPVFETG